MRFLLTVTTLILAVSISHGQSKKKKREAKTNVVMSSVKSYLGTPYKYGGMSRKGIDCSALLHVSFNKGGITLPRVAKDQSKFGKNVSWNGLKRGDLVFFKFKQKGEKWWHSGVITVAEKD